ncbi:DUF2625 family protein [Campylobacter curvus]|uniref:DUF2625 family protein n=1 Tax=Campylobacter curvus TaxID=200 RepID=UPI0032D59657
MKTLTELINLKEPGWKLIEEWAAEAKNHFEILPRDERHAGEELVALQVSTRSPMGAVVYESGGVLFYQGFVRLLGSGCERMRRGLASWNEKMMPNLPMQGRPYLIVADDVVGGIFAINGGGLGEDMGKIYYLTPDTLEWEDTQFSYSDFVYWLFCGDVAKFYEPYFFEGWQDAVAQLGYDETFSFYPFCGVKKHKT